MKKKNVFNLSIDKNSFVDNKSGKIVFKNGLTITDTSEQRNGTRYDVKSMDIGEYSGMLTADHSSKIESIIGRTEGVKKVANKRITIDGIQFAIEENALARFAYKMLKSGFLTDFSIETFGPWPDDDGVYKDSKLVGLSAVVVGNNRSATTNSNSKAVNQIALDVIEQAESDGLDASFVKNNFLCNNDDVNNSNSKRSEMYVTIKNTKNFPVAVTYKNASDDEVNLTLNAGESVDVSADQADAVKKQVEDAKEPESKTDAKEDEKESIGDVVKNALTPILKKVGQLEEKIFDNSAKEPEFKKDVSKKVGNDIKNMDWRKRHGFQILQAWNWLKKGNAVAQQKLIEANKINLEMLQKEGFVNNAITIADMGNFVISPELLSEIEGHRSNFGTLLSKLDFRETLSLQMAWLSRSGDINMEEVEYCDDDADGNLKPISEYTTSINQSNLHELAAVTPVCNAATRFLAADLLGDVAQGYRTDYDRKRAQLFIARLQQAVDSSGNKVPYNGTSDVTTLKSWIQTWVEVQEEIMGGLFIFNQKTYGELLQRAIGAGISGPLSGLFTTGDQPLIAGSPYVVVPNELLPSLNTAETKSFVVEGVTVTINQAVFYVDVATFSGRTSGGLMYDLSTEAAYEVDQTVKSAFQRNELVLRGSFFRGGAIRDEDKVVSMYAAGVS